MRVLSGLLHFLASRLSRLLPKRGKVLMFHSVGDERHALNISVASFEHLIHLLKTKKIVKLEEWKNYSKFFCITFDDVADSFYHNAFPILKKYNIPFTIFVSYSLLNKDGFITTEMLKEISTCELSTIGSHGMNHSYFKSYNKKEAIEDLRTSKEKLGSLIGKEVNIYAFPYGSIYACGLCGKKVVKRYYKYGFGTISSSITKPSLLPQYFLPRIVVSDNNYKSIIL